MENKNQMAKTLGLAEGLAIVIGMVIGSGIFFKPTAIFTATGAPGLGLIAWVVGAIMSIAGALTAAEVGAAIPETGGVTIYLKRIYGNVWGYLYGWSQSVIYYPAITGGIAIIFGTQVAQLLGLDADTVKYIAIAVILFLASFNIIGGTKASGKLQTVSTIAKLIPIAIIIAVGLLKGEGGVANLSPMTSPDHPAIKGLGVALLGVLFAYDGWINLGAVAGEMKNPQKDLPRSIIGGILFIMVVYMAINVAYLFVLPAGTLAATATPAADVAKVLFGAAGGKFITIGILVSMFGGLNSFFITGPRVPYALATENKIFASKWLSKLDKKGTPANATIFLTALMILYILTGSFDQLTNLITVVNWAFFTMTFAGVYILRKKEPDLYRPYKVPMYYVIPVIAVLGGVFIEVNSLLSDPVNSILGILLTVVGLPIYLYKMKQNRELEQKE